jgi:methionine synthase II (cobalamin-independent)
MENYTIKIPKNNAKAIALIEYLKTLDFIQLSETTDWWDEISNENKVSIERGIEDIKNDRIHSDEEVRNAIRKRISNAHKE